MRTIAGDETACPPPYRNTAPRKYTAASSCVGCGKQIPDTAVVSDQSRKIVFTVGEGNVVKAKSVTLGPIVDGLRVVRDGLAATDQVVLDGLANPMVRPGAKVVPQKGEITTAKAK